MEQISSDNSSKVKIPVHLREAETINTPAELICAPEPNYDFQQKLTKCFLFIKSS